MPFKACASLTRVTKLEGAVVAAAQLEADRLIAVLTSDPVKLWVQPISGGTGKANGIALDEVEELALLSKQAAVVKSGDALWGLLDIQHSPKIDQVGRDIRLLCGSPKGGGAFAVGWDGQGAALSMQGNEVGGRHFTLRGELRSASIDASHTHTVVEGGGGGQYRAHPGTTPEPGADARADLPLEAKELDRIAGGRELSALWQRGVDRVCVVRSEGGGSYGAKVIHLEVAATAVAVISTSLFCAGADGKLRLYDSHTLASAAGDTSVATHTLDLGADGEPAVLYATTRAGNRLWIGTRSGDLLRCDAVGRGMDI